MVGALEKGKVLSGGLEEGSRYLQCGFEARLRMLLRVVVPWRT